MLTSPRQGEPLSASWGEELTRTVNELSREMRGGAWGMVAALLAARLPERWVPAIITRIYPGDAGVRPYPAQDVFYDVVCVGQPSTMQEHVQPDIGRPVNNPAHQIHAALVRHPAVIIRANEPDGTEISWFLILSEVRATRSCSGL